MPAAILDGIAIANGSLAETKRKADALRAKGAPVRLVAVLVGEPPDALVYAKRQEASCQAVGIEYKLEQFPSRTKYSCLAARIDELNQDDRVTGVMLHLPLPRDFNRTHLQAAIHPNKDVEG